jgi:sec-independent protein translocase protein TatC
MKTSEEIELRNQTLTSHLIELRSRLINSLWAIFLGMIVCYNFTENIFEFIRAPIAPYLPTQGLVFTAPADKFIAHLKITFFSGIILACPFWLGQIWNFIAPGLYSREKRYSIGFMVLGTFLFLLGISFAYFLAFPAAFKFLLQYGGMTDAPMITISEYLSFFLWTSFFFGLSFELPLVLILLALVGVVNKKFLKEKRRYAIVGIAFISAVITPPDLLSMVLLLVPMWILYEISIYLVGFFEKPSDL